MWFEPQRPGLRYMQVADFLRTKILDGDYQPGTRLPRQHELAKQLNVAFTTLKRALDLLGDEGYVIRRVGQGTFATLPEQRKPHALVVDDDEGVREFFARSLALEGWGSVTVESGSEALDSLQEQWFDLIFVDLAMAGMNGAEVFRHIRRTRPQAVVVIITAHPDSALMAQALQAGPFAVMRKPITVEELDLVLGLAAHDGGHRKTGPARSRAPWKPLVELASETGEGDGKVYGRATEPTCLYD